MPASKPAVRIPADLLFRGENVLTLQSQDGGGAPASSPARDPAGLDLIACISCAVLVAGAAPQAGAPSALPAPFDTLVAQCLDPGPEAWPRPDEIAGLLGAKR